MNRNTISLALVGKANKEANKDTLTYALVYRTLKTSSMIDAHPLKEYVELLLKNQSQVLYFPKVC
jgi:HSP90 family molecular chaperone